MTAAQLDVMFSFLEQHPQLAKGRLRDLDGRVKANRLWEELADSLNAMGGTMKTVREQQKILTGIESGGEDTDAKAAAVQTALEDSFKATQ